MSYTSDPLGKDRYQFTADPLPPPLNEIVLTTWISDTTDELIAGKYLMNFSFIVNQDRTNRTAYYQLWIDGVQSGAEFSKESKDTADGFPMAQNAILLTFPTDGTHLIELKARVSNQQLDLTLSRYSHTLVFWQPI
tara:strand:- start:72 stop:479 length:408 start_codon:yes stop_codon:yes gene_type:complete